MIVVEHQSLHDRLPSALHQEVSRLVTEMVGSGRGDLIRVNRKKALRANMALVRLFIPRHHDPETLRRAQWTLNNLQEQL